MPVLTVMPEPNPCALPRKPIGMTEALGPVAVGLSTLSLNMAVRSNEAINPTINNEQSSWRFMIGIMSGPAQRGYEVLYY